MTKDRAAGHAGALGRRWARAERAGGRSHSGAGRRWALGRAGGRGAQALGRAERAWQASGTGVQALGARGQAAGCRSGALGLGARAGQGCALRLVFNPIFRLCIFPESLNKHCSL